MEQLLYRKGFPLLETWIWGFKVFCCFVLFIFLLLALLQASRAMSDKSLHLIVL